MPNTMSLRSSKLPIKLLALAALAPACIGDTLDVSRDELGIISEPPLEGCPKLWSKMANTAGEFPAEANIYNTADDLIITFLSRGEWGPDSWMLDSISIWTGTGSPPTDSFGNVDPSKFPTQVDAGHAFSAVVTLPLSVGCGGTLKIAAFATMSRGDEHTTVWLGTDCGDGSTWLFGTPLPNGGVYVAYPVCCGLEGCTYTIGYWKTHPTKWPVSSLVIGGVTYTQTQLLALLWLSPAGDASLQLAHQLIGSLLNLAFGASASASVQNSINAAQTWMANNRDLDGRLPYGVAPKTAFGQQATALNAALSAFNEGQAGTLHCDLVSGP